jgi:hypothetical protein
MGFVARAFARLRWLGLAGGGYDTYGPLVSQYMGRYLGVPRVVVKNLPGGGRIVRNSELYHARPDGLTLGPFNSGLIYRFDVDARVRLVTHWHRLLRRGGVVVTTQRIRPNSREARIALRKTSHVLTSPRDLASTFERTGFALTVADEGGGSLERERDRPSSTAGRDSYRMRLVAMKR